MANRTIPWRHTPDGEKHMNRELETASIPWLLTPRFSNSVQMTWRKVLGGVGATQTTTVTIPAAGFVSGRLTVTFSGGPLTSTVTVVADAAVGEANTDLAAALDTAMATAIAGDLAGVVTSATASTNTVPIVFVEGVGFVTVTVAYRPAQQIDLTLAGTLIDAYYRATFSGAGLGSDVVVTTTRSAGSPAAITDMIIQIETDIEAEGDLAGVVVSADDDASDTNTVIFEPDVADATITTLIEPESVGVTWTVADATPAGPTVTIATTVVIDLNSVWREEGFPADAMRSWCLCHVTETWGASRTLTVGDAGDPDAVLGATPIDLNATGASGSTTSEAEYQPRPEAAWVPTATIVLGASQSLTQGEFDLEVLWEPLPKAVAKSTEMVA